MAQRLKDFLYFLEIEYGTVCNDFKSLHTFSIKDLNLFWQAYTHFTKFPFLQPPTSFYKRGTSFQLSSFCEGSTLNFCAATLNEATKIITIDESGDRKEYTKEELTILVNSYIVLYQKYGVVKNDYIGSILPNGIEALVAYLAAGAIGAIFVPASPELGSQALSNRFSQVNPKLILTKRFVQYNGKNVPLFSRSDTLPYKLIAVEDIEISKEKCEFIPLPFDQPVTVLFTSGTTGKPKGLVHRSGGILLKHRLEQELHLELSRNNSLFFYTTTGWMMWQWLVSALSLGVELILYDGSPIFPKVSRLAEIASQEKVTHWGISPRYLSLLDEQNFSSTNNHDFSCLQYVITTGSPLLPKQFDFIHQRIKDEVIVAPISGGSDIVGCFLGPNALSTERPGEMMGPVLGCDIEVWREDGSKCDAFEYGELVCLQPVPSIPLCFLGDFDGSRYHESYFSKFTGVWNHGDRSKVTADNGYVISGRLDAVLNPQGVRLGVSEIYDAIKEISSIKEALCVSRFQGEEEEIILFIKLVASELLTESLQTQIRESIRKNYSPRAVPKYIIQAHEFPMTWNGKVSESVVRKAVRGEEINNLDALANPESVNYFVNLKFNFVTYNDRWLNN